MAANIQPIFPITPKMPSVRNATANTHTDGVTGVYQPLYTAGANGSLFRGVHVKYDTAPTQGDIVRLFHKPSGGTRYLWKEFRFDPCSPAASSAGVPPTQVLPEMTWLPEEGIVLGASDEIDVTTDQGIGNIVRLNGGGDY